MLYTLARRYDEYDGENYEGSSCRGAIKGWFNNGVCPRTGLAVCTRQGEPGQVRFRRRAPRKNTLGVYYRIDIKSITDMQAAVAQHGAVFASAFTHDGWDRVPASTKLPKGHADIPVIVFNGKPSEGRRPCLRHRRLQQCRAS